MLQVLTNMF